MDLSSLNPQQRDAVETIKGPVLILAGAGTGKTRVITFRMAWMIRRGIPPGNILGVTFTNKAAKEMKERIAQLVSKPRSKEDKKSEWLTISTFHSLGVRLLRQYIERLGYKKNFVIYSDSEQIGLIKRIMSNISSKGDKVDPREILSLLSRHKNAGPNSTAFADANVSALADIVRSRYDTALRACNAVDFDDLLVLTLRLLEEHSDVLEECRNRFQYVMVDEYQDTNAAQFKLVQLLTEKHRNLCVVGDDDQSIYGWRGAEIANLLDLEKYYPEVKVIKLEQNYRSTNVILKAANAVIKHNSRRRVKQLWSQKGQGENIRIVAFPNEDEEATSIVEAIEFNRLARGIPWANQAILYRTNIQSRPIEMALRKAGVRYHLVGGQSFFDRREVKDSMAYFKMFINPHDDNNLLRIANVPARGLSDVTMERLLSASAERHCSVYNAMQHTDILAEFAPRSRQSILDFVQLIEETRAPLVSGDAFALAPWSEKLFTEIGYIADLRKSEKNQETAENRIRNLKDILATLDDELMDYPKPLARLEAFLEDLTLDTERAEDKEIADNSVILITIHSCKGLEFPHVFLVGLEDGMLPHSRSKVEGTLEEERRLFYVAITRAKETLSLSFCQSRKKYGELSPCHPSPFLNELPKELVEWEDQKAAKPVSKESGKNMFAAMRSALGT